MIKLLKYIRTGDKRSKNLKKNIVASFFIKGASIGISLILVPLTLTYIDPTRYGIWLTLNSIISWFNFFDIGIGNGLRNKFAEAKAKNDLQIARTYVSTSYAILSIVISIVFLIFLLVNSFLDWSTILNTLPELGSELTLLVIIVFSFFCIKFILQLITSILTADQKPAIASFIALSGSILSLLIIYVLTKTTNGSLLFLGTALSASPVLILIIASVFYFRNQYKDIAPAANFVDFKYSKKLLNLGLQFFVIHISSIIIFSTNNLIITQLFSPAEVTPYNIAYRYLSTAQMLFAILLTPFWSVFTDAYVKNEMSWIKKTLSKILKFWILLLLGLLILLILSKPVYKLWIGNKVLIPFSLSAILTVYIAIQSWNSIFATVINGVGKIRIQLLASVFIALINIPLCIIFAKYLALGLNGIILGNILSLIPGSIMAVYQTKLIINKEDYGLWAK